MDKAAYFEQMRRKRRTEILDEAREMILNQGISDFNIQQLARNLDISTVTLYKYFKNSDDIMIAIKEQIVHNNMNQADFLPSSISDTSGLDSFLLLLRNFYAKALSQRDDVTLLLLFNVHMRSNPSAEKQDSSFQTLFNKFEDKMRDMLGRAVEDGSVKPGLDIDEAIQFISRMNLSMLNYIGLLSAEDYAKEESALQKQISQLIHMFSLYLTAL